MTSDYNNNETTSKERLWPKLIPINQDHQTAFKISQATSVKQPALHYGATGLGFALVPSTAIVTDQEQ
jgi:hypothetical protein